MPRHRFNPMADTRSPHWVVVSDMQQNLIACEALPAGADLREALQVVLTICAAEGWRAETDGAYGFTFIYRGTERRLVNLTPANPADNAGQGHAFLAGHGATG